MLKVELESEVIKLKRRCCELEDRICQLENDVEYYEEENGTCGWSMMHLLNVYARLCDKRGAKTAIEFFVDHYS